MVTSRHVGLLAVVLAVAVSCGDSKKRSRGEVSHADLAQDQRAQLAGPKGKKGGVYELQLDVQNVQSSPGEPYGPELLIVSVEEEPLDDGSLVLEVKPLHDVLATSGCDESRGCRKYRARFGEEYKPNLLTCTGTFVSPDEIFTAAHCLTKTNWEKTFGVIGYHADSNWEIVRDKFGRLNMIVPAAHVVRLCHVLASERPTTRGLDFAHVHVCPVAKDPVAHQHRSLYQGDGADLVNLSVTSHAMGLPLKQYSARFLASASPALSFTNSGGGSGAAVINSSGEIVGVVRGYVNDLLHTDCPSDSKYCKGQRVTWFGDIQQILRDQRICNVLEDFRAHDPQTCPKP